MSSRYEDDRIYYERDRESSGRERDRFYEDDRVYMRGGRGRDDGYDRRPPPPRGYDDDFVRDRRFHDDDFRNERRGPPSGGSDYDRRIYIDRERDRDYYREPSPRRPPVLTRRQSSLDTYDRRPLRGFEPREEYPPPARREDIRRDDFRDEYRAPAYTDIPLPRREVVPPPRRHEREYYDDEKITDRDYYVDEGRRYPEHVHEREIIRERDRRDESPAKSHSHTHHSRSRASSSSSSSRGGASTVLSEFPKRGKTRIPAKLVHKRAIIDLQYPFEEEGTTIIIQRALGQDHIDELLKLSEDYIKTEVEITEKVSAGGDVVKEHVEERREERREEVVVSPPAPRTIVIPPPAPAPVVVDAHPHHHHDHDSLEVTEKTVIRESSPHRHRHPHHHHGEELVVARPRSRSRSRSGRDIRHEIRALERELAHRPKTVEVDDYDIVRTERMEDGEMVVYEERVEKVSSHKPPRIEKDKKGPNPGLLRAMMTTLT